MEKNVKENTNSKTKNIKKTLQKNDNTKNKKSINKKENDNNKSSISKKKNDNKKLLLISLIGIFLVLGITSFVVFKFVLKRKIVVEFSLLGNEEVTIFYGDTYEEDGFNLTVDGIDSKNVKIKSLVDYDVLGRYEIDYTYVDDNNDKHVLKRYITIVDNENPVITLEGNDVINIIVGEEFVDPGYKAIDNYDGDISKNVVVSGEVNFNNVGMYEIVYKVCDSSFNEFEVKRVVNVIKPKAIIFVTEDKVSENTTNMNQIVSSGDNTVIYNRFTNDGIYLEGILNNNNGNVVIKLVNGETIYEYNMNVSNNKYSGNILFSDVVNGSYEVYISSNDENRLENKMNLIDKIVRAKIGDKLVTVNYENNLVSIIVEDFYYQYDVLIDVGHGGIGLIQNKL